MCSFVCFVCVCTHMHVLAQTLSAKRQWSGTWEGQRSICSNPSSCQCLPLGCSLLMAPSRQRSRWVPSGRESHSQENRSQRDCGMTSHKPPSHTGHHCVITQHVWYKTLSATAGGDTQFKQKHWLCAIQQRHQQEGSSVLLHSFEVLSFGLEPYLN